MSNLEAPQFVAAGPDKEGVPMVVQLFQVLPPVQLFHHKFPSLPNTTASTREEISEVVPTSSSSIRAIPPGMLTERSTATSTTLRFVGRTRLLTVLDLL